MGVRPHGDPSRPQRNVMNYLCDRNGELLSGCAIRQLAGIKELGLLPLTTFADLSGELTSNQIRNSPDGPRFIQTRKN
ncbi:MAG: hypothetical protein JWN70_813 [Planctomycetaceae bacterium]|nr:hypothetical protein [Planctomycetaceae bacterium]